MSAQEEIQKLKTLTRQNGALIEQNGQLIEQQSQFAGAIDALGGKLDAIGDTRKMYSARFDKNDDGIETYTMVLPIVAGEIMNEDGTITIQL